MSDKSVQQIVAECLSLPEAEHQAYLERECADDPKLRAAVDERLQVDTSGLGVLDSPVLDRDALEKEDPDELPPLLLGDRIGGYQLEEEIGRGGGGVVFRARQVDGELDRKVAVKILRPGTESEEFLRRFRAERQTLVNLIHPNIARLLEAGTEDGRPYLVLELIEGEQIDHYCRKRNLSIPDILQLFQEVCGAVHLAHQNLIVHRDLKPSNILVTKDAKPKLLDFGIAKILKDAPATTLTVEARLMTPLYASPEQIRGKQITTASDIFSLGILLYELLTGRHPFRTDEAASEKIARAICEEAPDLPSTSAQTTSSESDSGTATTRRLRRRLAGDLDTIILKALHKEPHRRYSSVQAFSEDIDRHLAGEPVTARPDSVVYKASRFARRHWKGLAAVAALFLVTLAFGIVTAVQQRETERERDRAERVADLLVDTFSIAEPGESQGEKVLAGDLLRSGLEQVQRDSAIDPLLRARFLGTIADAFVGLGLYSEARPLREELLRTTEELHGSESVDVAEAIHNLADVLARQSKYPEARKGFERALSILGTNGLDDGTRRADSLAGLGTVLYYQGEYQQAENEIGTAIEILRGESSADPELLAQAAGDLAGTLLVQAKYEEAEPLFRESLALKREHLGETHPSTAVAISNLCWFYARQEKRAEAEPYCREALKVRRKILPEGHPKIAVSLNNLGSTLEALGEVEEAGECYREALEIWIAAYGRQHQDVGTALNNLGLFLSRRDELAEAEKLLRESLQVRRAVLGSDHPEVGHSMNNLSELLYKQGRFEEAEELQRETLELRKKKDSPQLCVGIGG